MKIAIFTDTFYPEINGVVTFQLNLTKYLSHKFYIFAPEYPSKMYGKTIKEKDFGKNVVIKRYKSIKLISNPATRIVTSSYRNVKRDFEKIKPDLIHVQTMGIIGLYGLTLAKKYHIPSITTYHTYFPDFVSYLSPIKLLKLDHLIGNLIFGNLKITFNNLFLDVNELHPHVADLFRLVYFPFKLIFSPFKLANYLTKKSLDVFSKSFTWAVSTHFYNQFDLITAPSELMVRILKEHGFFKPTIFLSNGIELNSFKFKKRDPTQNIHLLHVGRLGFEKNVDILLKMMTYLNKNKLFSFELTIVGDGPARKKLEQLKHELKLDNVYFLGAKSRTELSDYYLNSDIFVTASTIETQGIVILESLATGLPVVGVDQLAIKDLIIDSYNGLKAKPFDPEDLADKVLELLSYDFSKLSHNARKSVEMHEIKHSMRKFDEIYRELVKFYRKYSRFMF